MTIFYVKDDPYNKNYKPLYSPIILYPNSKLPYFCSQHKGKTVKEVIEEDLKYLMHFIYKRRIVVKDENGNVMFSRATEYKLNDRITFGKYNDKKISHIMKLDPSYIDWLIKFDYIRIIDESQSQ